MAFYIQTINGNNLEQSVVSNTAILESNVHSMVFDETTGVEQVVEVRINGIKTVTYKLPAKETTTIKDTINVPASTAMSLVVPDGVNAIVNYVQIAVDPAAALTSAQTAAQQAADALPAGTIDDNTVAVDKVWSSTKLSENQITLETDTSDFYIEQEYIFKITNFDSFRTYVITPTLGTTEVDFIDPTLIKYTAPSTAGTESITINDKTITFAVTGESILPPTILSPENGAPEAESLFSVTLDTFTTVPASSDTHLSTTWEVATDAGFSTVVFSSANDLVNLNTITTTSTDVKGQDYYVRAKFGGNTLADSAWSDTVKVTVSDFQTSFVKIPTAKGAEYYDEENNIMYVTSGGSTSNSTVYIVGIDLDTNTKIIEKSFTGVIVPTCMTRDVDGKFYIGGLYSVSYMPCILTIDSTLTTIEKQLRTPAGGGTYWGAPSSIIVDNSYIYMDTFDNQRSDGILRVDKYTYTYEFYRNGNSPTTTSNPYNFNMKLIEGKFVVAVRGNVSGSQHSLLNVFDKDSFVLENSYSIGSSTADYVIDYVVDNAGYTYYLIGDSTAGAEIKKMNSTMSTVESKTLTFSGTHNSSLSNTSRGVLSLSPDGSTLFVGFISASGNTNGLSGEAAPTVASFNTADLTSKEAVVLSATNSAFTAFSTYSPILSANDYGVYQLKALSNKSFIFTCNATASSSFIWKGTTNTNSASTLSLFAGYAEVDASGATVESTDSNAVFFAGNGSQSYKPIQYTKSNPVATTAVLTDVVLNNTTDINITSEDY